MQPQNRNVRIRLQVVAVLLATLLLALSACADPKPTPLPTLNVDSVEINQGDQSLVVGVSTTLTATVTADEGADATVTWKSEDEAVATITQAGELEALEPGVTVVTAASALNPEKTDSIEVTVTAVPTPSVVRVTINEGDQKLALDQTFSFTALAEVELDAESTVNWTSSNEVVATIDEGGVLEIQASGTTTVTATSTFDPTKKDSVMVEVYDPAVPVWTHQFGTGLRDRAYSAATDADGNVVVVGETRGVMPGSSYHGLYDVYVQKLTPAGAVLWTEQVGTDEWDTSFGVAIDADNNIIVVVRTVGELIPGQAPSGESDMFVMKLSPDGNNIWLERFQGEAGVFITGVATDSGNNIIVTGYTPGNFDRPAQGFHDSIVLKADASGQEVWRKQFGSTRQDLAQAVVTDSADNILIAGTTTGTLPDTLEGGPQGGGVDAFVHKLDANGNHVWTSQFGTTGQDRAYGVITDSEDNIIAVGFTSGEFSGAAALGESDAFARKLAPDGSVIWTRQFGSSEADEASGVATDTQDNIIVVGSTQGEFAGNLSGDQDAFAHKLDPAGNIIRTIQFGVTTTLNVRGVTTDVRDNFFMFGDTDGVLGDEHLGDWDAFVRKYAP